MTLNETEVRSLFCLAGFSIHALKEMPNQYWPDAEGYAEVRRHSPWWFVVTDSPLGFITIGWRKSVISIDWQESTFRGVITDDDVTKADSMVHAWSYVKALDYLTKLRAAFAKATSPRRDKSVD